MGREAEIVRLLMRADDYVSYKSLAERLGVSDRTIRSDVDKIERRLSHVGARVERDRRRGVRIAGDVDAAQMAGEFGGSSGWSSDARQASITRTLLAERGEVTVKSLAYSIDASRNTVLGDLKVCADDLARDGVMVVQKPHQPITLSYGESSYRDAVVRRLLNDSGAHTMGQYAAFAQTIGAGDERLAFADRFGAADGVQAVEDSVRRYEQEEGSKLTDAAFLKVCLYLVVMACRFAEGRRIGANAVRGMAFQPNERSFAALTRMTGTACDALAVDGVDGTELRYLYCYIRAQQAYYLSDDLPVEGELAERFLERVQCYLSVNLESDPTLLQGLKQHITPAIHRLIFGIRIENPLAPEIMERYPTVFRACRWAGGVFQERFGYELDNNEVSLLALHVAASMEKLYGSQVTSFKRAFVVCASGIGTSSMLVARLHATFPALKVVGVLSVSELSEADFSQVDCVLSTVEIRGALPVPVTYVTPLVNDFDIVDIERQVFSQPGQRAGDPLGRIATRVGNEFGPDVSRRVIQIVRDELRIDRGSRGDKKGQLGLMDLLSDDCVLFERDASDTWREAIGRAGSILLCHGHIEERYVEAMVRMVEELGPYMVVESGLAIAHARTEDGALSTGMSFVVYENPVTFDGCPTPVRVVVGLAVGQVKNHLDAMEDLARIAQSKGTMDEWASTETPHAFVEFARERLARASEGGRA